MKMKEVVSASAALLLLTGSGCVTGKCDPALEQKVSELEQKLMELKNEQAESIGLEELFGEYFLNGQVSGALMMRYLKLIAPPKNPTPEQIREYIGKVSGIKNITRRNQPQIQETITSQLTQFGREYLPEMLPFLDNSGIQAAAAELARPEDKELLYAYAINGNNPNRKSAAVLFLNLANESDKDAVLKLLPENPDAIDTVIRLKMEKDALGIITNKLRRMNQLDNNNNNSNNYYDKWLPVAINNLDEAERRQLLEEMWSTQKAQGMNDQWRILNTAVKLASFGCLPAFHYMASNCIQYNGGQAHQVLSLSPFRNFNDFKNWYQKNKDILVFDRKQNIFTVPAGQEDKK